jgi:hypothetical protein
MVKFNLIVHPIATGVIIEVRSTNARNKAWVKIGSNNGHYWMQFNDAKGYVASFIHEVSANNFVNEMGLFMPNYIYPMIQYANNIINSFVQN